ncbi:MAG: aminotransferase class I/II-fold pyridoxal phosphate-dependent enzyme, partial [Chitinophagaceae bacterium]
LPLQLAAAKALEFGQEWHDEVNIIYTKRRKKVFELLKILNCSFEENQAGLFVWASVPSSFKDGYDLSDKVLGDANVFITPGGIFGSEGDKYVRISLCTSEDKIEEAINRIKIKVNV